MKPWQFNVLFLIAAAGSVFLLFAKKLGIELDPTALTGFGAILTYVLWRRDDKGGDDDEKPPGHRKDGS